jgi:hypothetical protein
MTYARGDPAISQKLYEADRSNVAVRLGVAAALGKTAPTLLRAAYGIFYDRPFDNLWQNIRNNGIVVGGASLSEPPSKPPIDYLPASDLLSTFNGYTARNFPRVTLYQPVLRDGYVQTGFLGLQRPIGTAWMLEVNGAVSIGHKLLTNDVINRYLSVPKDQRTERPLGQYRADLPFISYRANQGNSAYGGFTVVGRYRGRGLQMQASYTLGHSIDNQSEPLRGEFFDLNETHI